MKYPTTTIYCRAAIFFAAFAFSNSAIAQSTMPVPGAAKTVTIPAVKEAKLKNGLTLAVVERKNVPLVTVQLLIKGGANLEDRNLAGLANQTLSLLTKGTVARSATEIAQQIEFLGGSIDPRASWLNSTVTLNIMSDKLDKAMAIMSDVVLNPTFKQSEIDLMKSQSMDNLSYNLKQPGYLATYVANAYSFGEHPTDGTPSSLAKIDRDDIVAFHQNTFSPANSVLVFTGDISAARAHELAGKYFGSWKSNSAAKQSNPLLAKPKVGNNRILVIDLPESGQAAVKYAKYLDIGRVSGKSAAAVSDGYYPALVLNSVLGGGYSARLNQEIRIKRGLSYGARSGFTWRNAASNFSTGAQTKNESAAEVAELVIEELKKLADKPVEASEMTPRKLVLTGNFGRQLETTSDLAAAVSDLYTFGLPTSELNNYMKSVNAVSDNQIREFAKANLPGGDIIIVGDHSKFKDELTKRFPDWKVDVIKADQVDLGKLY